MANNFRILPNTGTGVFFCKDGNDANTGLGADPTLSKQTPNEITGQVNYVIGAGEYKGAFSLHAVSGTTFQFDPDGYVKFRCTADFLLVQNAITIFNEQEAGIIEIDLQGFKIKNSAVIVFQYWKGAIIRDGIFEAGASSSRTRLIRTVIESMTTTNALSDFLLDYSLVFNSSLQTQNASTAESIVSNTYFDAASSISMAVYFSAPTTQFKNNNFQGQIIVGGTTYELKQDKDGNAIDPNPAFTDLIAIDASVYTRGNFSQDPAYLNLSKRDYWSVDNSSPNLFADETNASSIGLVKSASLVKATDTPFASPSSSVDIIESSGDLLYNVVAATGSGQIVSAAIQAFPIAQQVSEVFFAELLNFNSLEVVGSAENQQVVISDNYATTTAGANPRRLTFEMRWTDQDSEPTISADYTNNGYITAGDYAKFEQFEVPMIDLSGNGNGSPSYVATGAVPILAKWVQIRITIFEGIG